MLCSPGVSALQRQLCFAAPETVLCSQGLCSAAPGKDKGEEFVLWGTRLCFVAPGGMGGTGGVVLCSARREGFVLWSTRFCFAAPVGMGGNRVVVLCSARGGERRGVCALEHQVELCSTRKDGGEERRGALRQGRGEERGLCFAAPEGMDGNKGVVLCSARGGEGGLVLLEYKVLCSMRGDGGEQGVCALQHQGRGEERGLCF